MPPIVAFLMGVLCAEVMVMGLWWPIQAKPTLKTYFEGIVGHSLVLAGVGGMFCMLWSLEGLDVVIQWLPDELTAGWADTGVPYTPQIGAVAGFLLAFRVGKIASAVKSRLPEPMTVTPAEGPKS